MWDNGIYNSDHRGHTSERKQASGVYNLAAKICAYETL